MEVLTLNENQLMEHRNNLNQHLQLVFNSQIEVDINEEILCGVIAITEEKIVACGFAYQRTMSQSGASFKAGIVGGIAVHPDYQRQGLSKKVLRNIDQKIEQVGIKLSFLFAYEPSVYVASGYANLVTPIHYYDRGQNQWNTFVYRGGMVKNHHEISTLLPNEVIEFNGPVY